MSFKFPLLSASRPRRRSTRAARQAPHRARLAVEALEDRYALATLASATRLTYQDSDGDRVAVTFSQPILNAANVNTIFTFGSGAGAVNGSNATPEQLRQINLVGVAGAAGTTITTSATRSAVTGGDGFAALGMIDAGGLDLGAVVIDGDLGSINAGDGTTSTRGLKGLTVHSLGRYGISTGAFGLTTVIQGPLDFLRVKTDVKEASVRAEGDSAGKIGSVVIGGSLIGGGGGDSGRISSGGAMGVVKIGGNFQGGAGGGSGSIFSNHTLASVTIGGSVLGGSGNFSGRIGSDGAMGVVKIAGNLQGGAGPVSGFIFSSSTLASVTIGGSVLGGSGVGSGGISSNGAMGAVKIGGNLQGGAGGGSGSIFSNHTLATVTIGGSVLGGAGPGSGGIDSHGALGVVKIAGNLQGGAGETSGFISSNSTVASVTIGGSVLGGSGNISGSVQAVGALGTVKIAGDVRGGTAGAASLTQSGAILAQRIGRLVIRGSLIAGVDTDPLAGVFKYNGAVRVGDDIGSATIGNLIGNSTSMALISARGSAAPTATTDLAIGRLTVRGRVEMAQILAGFDLNGDAVNADAQVGTVSVGGDWVASSLVAGAVAGNDGYFGNADANEGQMSGFGVKNEAGVSSRISSLSIAGQVLGTVGDADFFGVVAENVAALRVGSVPVPLSAGGGNDDVFLGISGDFKINEV